SSYTCSNRISSFLGGNQSASRRMNPFEERLEPLVKEESKQDDNGNWNYPTSREKVNGPWYPPLVLPNWRSIVTPRAIPELAPLRCRQTRGEGSDQHRGREPQCQVSGSFACSVRGLFCFDYRIG